MTGRVNGLKNAAVDNMSRGIIDRVSAVLSAKALTLVASIALNPILVRSLGQNVFGEYTYIKSIIGVLSIFVSVCIFDGLRKFLATKEGIDHGLVYQFILLSIINISIVVFFIFITKFFFDFPETFDLITTVAIIFGLMVGQTILAFSQGLLMGTKREQAGELMNTFREFGNRGFAILAGIAGLGVLGALIGHIVTFLIILIFTVVLMWGTIQIKPHRIWDIDIDREVIYFSYSSVVFTLIMSSLYHIDIVLLRPEVGAPKTAEYKAALMIAEFVWFIPIGIQTVLVQSSSDIWENKGIEDINLLVNKIMSYNMSYSILVAIGIAVLSKPFLGFYFGPQYRSASMALLILLPGALFFAIARPLMAIGQGKGEMRVLMICTGLAAVVNLILNLLLIPRHGTIGAAVATSIGYGTMLLAHCIGAKVIGYKPLPEFPIYRLVLISVVVGSVLYLIQNQLSGVTSFIIIPSIGFGLFTLLIHHAGIINLSEIRQS
ncbi:MATE family efflux transporter [Haloferax volcanii]|uniref:MATE family efflux transporter n=1 Tax=Haloferax volcanii TaxID=2246 RepID=UPI00385207B4